MLNGHFREQDLNVKIYSPSWKFVAKTWQTLLEDFNRTLGYIQVYCLHFSTVYLTNKFILYFPSIKGTVPVDLINAGNTALLK